MIIRYAEENNFIELRQFYGKRTIIRRIYKSKSNAIIKSN